LSNADPSDHRLDPSAAGPQVQILLETIVEIIKARPLSVQPVLGKLYSALGIYCRKLGPTSQLLDPIRRAVGTPLSATHAPGMPYSLPLLLGRHGVGDANSHLESFTETAYHELAVSFLTQPDLFLFESNVGYFAAAVDVDRLSDSLQRGITTGPEVAGSQAGLMWLLSHFIVLQKTKNQIVLHSRSLRVLYSLLSALSVKIRTGFGASYWKISAETGDVEDTPEPMLPPYVSDRLASLTDRDEISGVLEKFTS
jgi:ubiquitin-protein ligase E3 C